jgi:hypothetical protein
MQLYRVSCSGVTILVLSSVLLGTGREALAQRTHSIRPAENSPSQSLGVYGRVGGYLGQSERTGDLSSPQVGSPLGLNLPTPLGRESALPFMSARARARHGVGNHLGKYAMEGESPLGITGLSPRSLQLSPMEFNTRFNDRSYPNRTSLQNSVGFRELPLIGGGLLEREELLSRGSDLELPPEGDQKGAEQADRRMIETRHERLKQKREEFEAKGWAAFRDKNYTLAYSLFDTVDAIAGQEPDGKYGKFCAAFASEKWMLAARNLSNMLGQDSYSFADVLREERFTLQGHYADVSDLATDAEALTKTAIIATSDPMMNAMHALVEWLRGNRREAYLAAERVYRFSPYSEWGKMSAMIVQATQATQQPGTAPAATRPGKAQGQTQPAGGISNRS